MPYLHGNQACGELSYKQAFQTGREMANSHLYYSALFLLQSHHLKLRVMSLRLDFFLAKSGKL